MKYVIIGDTHGKLAIVEHFLSDKYKDVHKVFIGDYVDSFDRSVEDQVKIVKLLLEAVQEREDVTALLGNHEMSYMKEGMRCSGYKDKTQNYMSHLELDVLVWFENYFYITDDILVTHAGASSYLFEDKADVKTKLEDDDKSLYYIGHSRGGREHCGGIFWCDYWREFSLIEGLTQIVGHSAHRPLGEDEGIVEIDGCYNIDCLDRVNQVLEVDVLEDSYTIEAVEFNCG